MCFCLADDWFTPNHPSNASFDDRHQGKFSTKRPVYSRIAVLRFWERLTLFMGSDSERYRWEATLSLYKEIERFTADQCPDYSTSTGLKQPNLLQSFSFIWLERSSVQRLSFSEC